VMAEADRVFRMCLGPPPAMDAPVTVGTQPETRAMRTCAPINLPDERAAHPARHRHPPPSPPRPPRAVQRRPQALAPVSSRPARCHRLPLLAGSRLPPRAGGPVARGVSDTFVRQV
jgi:hypothetical protein